MRNALAALFLSLSPPQTTSVSEQCHKNCVASDEAVTLVQAYEGYSPFIYKDIAGYPTIGHGHLIVKGEKFDVPLLPEPAMKLLEKDMGSSVKDVNRYVNVSLWQSQFDALTSWTFNLGGGALKSSTMLKRVNAERHAEVPGEMKKWNKALDPKTKQRVVSRGLVVRREGEATMYMRDELANPK